MIEVNKNSLKAAWLLSSFLIDLYQLNYYYLPMANNDKTTHKKKNNAKNLKSLKDRPIEERKKIAKSGGIKSGVVKREKKLMSQIYAEFLQKEHEVKIKNKNALMTGYNLINKVVGEVIKKGGAPAVSLMKEIREATEGSKLDLSGSVDLPIKIEINPIHVINDKDINA